MVTGAGLVAVRRGSGSGTLQIFFNLLVLLTLIPVLNPSTERLGIRTGKNTGGSIAVIKKFTGTGENTGTNIVYDFIVTVTGTRKLNIQLWYRYFFYYYLVIKEEKYKCMIKIILTDMSNQAEEQPLLDDYIDSDENDRAHKVDTMAPPLPQAQRTSPTNSESSTPIDASGSGTRSGSRSRTASPVSGSSTSTTRAEHHALPKAYFNIKAARDSTRILHTGRGSPDKKNHHCRSRTDRFWFAVGARGGGWFVVDASLRLKSHFAVGGGNIQRGHQFGRG
jgi:hypothetical protein